MPDPEMLRSPIRKRLPTRYYTEIGRIVVIFARVEGNLFHLTHTVLGIDRRHARLAVRKVRAAEQLTLIQDLAKLNGLKLNVKWGTLKSALKEAESFRDRLSHCIWLNHPNTRLPVLQDFSRAYIPNLTADTNPRINPLAVEIPLAKLVEIRTGISEIAAALEKLETAILEQLETSPGKPPPLPPAPRRRVRRSKNS